MTQDEIAMRLRLGGLALAFDTNAIYFDRKFIKLCNAIKLYNERLAEQSRQAVRLLVCAVAHAEKLFDLKQHYRDRFDDRVILDGLRSKGLEIHSFDARHALETAIRLGERYADEAEWHHAKKERCIRCVGLDPAKVSAPGTGRRCGATVDWLIGAHARAEGCVLVTDETGPEFAGITERVKLETLEAAVHQVLAEPT